MNKKILIATGLLLMPAAAHADDAEIRQMRQQIETLTRKLEALETRQTTTEVKQGEALTERDLVGSMPGSIRIPGTNTSLKIGGYVKLDGLYDFGHPAGSTTAGSAIPLGDVPVRDNQFQFNARQSRITVATETPFDDDKLQTLIEVDFYGAGGTEQSSNSAGMRLRQAVATYGGFTVGQTYTTLFDAAASGEVLDLGSRPADTSLRQPLIRYTLKDGPGTFAIALENPEGDFIGNVPGNNSQPTNLGSVPSPNLDHMPDLVGKYTYSFGWGHLGVEGVLRQISIDTGVVEDSVVGYGIGVSGSVKLGAKDKFGFQALYTDGAARYFQLGYGSSASFDGTSLDTQQAWGVTFALQNWWTDTVRTNVVFDYQKTDNNDGVIATANEELLQVHANVMASVTPAADVGLEYIYGSRTTVGAGDGNASRLQGSFIYKF